MKKVLSLVIVVAMVLSLAGCGGDHVVADAVDMLKQAWTEYYRDTAVENDGYLQLVNTRLITFKENGVQDMRNIAYVVEFVLYTGYYGSDSYHAQTTGFMDTVTVYKDGTMEVGRNPLKDYSTTYYSWDYSAFVESVEDLGDDYNFTEYLK